VSEKNPSRPLARRALRRTRRTAGRAVWRVAGTTATQPPAMNREPAPASTPRTAADWKSVAENLQREVRRLHADHEQTTSDLVKARGLAARREKELAARNEDLAAWTARLDRPSFLREHRSWVELGLHYRQDPSPAKERIGELNRKLWVHAFATSHGIPVPRIHAIGERPEDIRLADLPEEFVVKSDGGTSSRAVIPLRRVGVDQYEWLGHEPRRVLGTAEVVEHFQVARAREVSYGPVFAEELLQGKEPGSLPDDVKIYVAYGKVLQVLLRRAVMVNGRPVTRTRYVSDIGRDLGKVALWQDTHADIPVPAGLRRMVAMARKISLALPMPLCRVDLYETPSGPVLGEITRTPGAPHLYRPDHDEFMGREWHKAEARLFEDMHHGRSGRPVWGDRATLAMIDDLPPFA
jgi:hypothetical protein